jgi:hypothetical protein
MEFVKMMIDLKITENCNPLKLTVEQLQCQISNQEERLKSLKLNLDNVDAHYMQCCRAICAT